MAGSIITELTISFVISLFASSLCTPIIGISETNSLSTDFYDESQPNLSTGIKKTFLISHVLDANWHKAERFCTINNMHLASIASQEENDELLRLMHKHDMSFMWIGATDQAEEGRFYWVSNGAALNFTKWQEGEPNNANGGEHCASMTRTGTWNDAPCNWPGHFACESDFKPRS